MPPVIPDYDKTLSTECTLLAEQWEKVALIQKYLCDSSKNVNKLVEFKRIL